MHRRIILLVFVVLAALLVSAPAAGDNGAGELNASFQAGLSGGSAIEVHSAIADALASPQVNPEGRLQPFGTTENICSDLVVGTWVFVVDDDRAFLDAWTNEFKLDGEVLDTVRTPNKRYAQGLSMGLWWFAEGVPVLGVLDEGTYDIEYTFNDGFGGTATINTTVNVVEC